MKRNYDAGTDAYLFFFALFQEAETRVRMNCSFGTTSVIGLLNLTTQNANRIVIFIHICTIFMTQISCPLLNFNFTTF